MLQWGLIVFANFCLTSKMVGMSALIWSRTPLNSFFVNSVVSERYESFIFRCVYASLYSSFFVHQSIGLKDKNSNKESKELEVSYHQFDVYHHHKKHHQHCHHYSKLWVNKEVCLFVVSDTDTVDGIGRICKLTLEMFIAQRSVIEMRGRWWIEPNLV